MEESIPQENEKTKTSIGEKLKTQYALHKKLFLIGSVILVIVLLSTAIVLIAPPQNTTNTSPPTGGTAITTPEDSQSQAQSQASENPLIDKEDVKKVEDAYKKQYESQRKKYPESPNYNFHYKLVPQLQDARSSFLFVKPVQAATTDCNVSSAPADVTIYKLKSKLKVSEATLLAKSFGITALATSVPLDGSVDLFQYNFAQPETSKFLTVAEPSGTYHYHQAPSTTQTQDIGSDHAKTIAQGVLTAHSITGIIPFSPPTFELATNQYVFSSEKAIDTFSMVDKASITALGGATSVCNVGKSLDMNKIQVNIDKEGVLSTVMNRTRMVTGTFSAKRATLEASRAEWETTLPIAPVVIGTGIPTSDVTIDQVILVWYDYGEVYSQKAYVPMYLTSGLSGNGIRVLTLFPAVAKAALTTLHIATSNKNLQIDAFNPKPPPATGTGQCYGNLVDYTVVCNQAGASICNGSFSLPVGTSLSVDGDPLNVCGRGCQSKADIYTPITNNPCTEFLQKHDIQPNNPVQVEPGYSGGEVNCSLNACPC